MAGVGSIDGARKFTRERWTQFRARWRLLELLPAAGAGGLSAYGLSWLVGIVVPLGLPIAIGVLTGSIPPAVGTGVGSPESRRVMAALGLVAFIFFGQRLFEPAASMARVFATRRIDAYAQARMMRAVMEPTGIAHLEDPEVLDRLRLANTPLGPVVIAIPQLLGRYLTAVMSCLIVAAASPAVAVVVAAVVVVQRMYWRNMGLEMNAVVADAQPAIRRSAYFSGLVLTPGAAKEVRVFGLVDWLVQRQRHHWQQSVEGRWRWYGKMIRDFSWALPARFVGYAVPYTVLAHAAATGRISLALFVTAVQAAGTAIGTAAATAEDVQLQQLIAAYPAIGELEEVARAQRLEARPTESASADASGPAPAPDVGSMPAREIRIEGLRFAYPRMPNPVYDGLDLTINAGQSLAIVGANGAGKTTLIKLLARLYEPDAGTISIDGSDLRDLDPERWRRQIAVIFQDFVPYPFSAADNVGLGAPACNRDLQTLERAARRAGALQVIEGLPKGWNTVLSRMFTDGADLSGGEWQRIALARALFAVEAGARLLVLDEPTANLDVRAEAELFDRFLDLTRGLTTILVSHRFSTVRHADRICVVEGGRITEDGDHHRLMALGGRYAEMFLLQANRFRDDPVPPGVGATDGR